MGFGGEHPINVGQFEDNMEKGYGGFQTQGLMTAAVKGRGETLQDEAAALSGEARTMADELERSSDYLKRRELAGMGDELDTAGFDAGQGDLIRQAVRAQAEQGIYGDYRDQLGAWRAAEQGRVQQGRDFADQVGDNPATQEIEGIPLHEWAQLAAIRDYGIDPNIAGGLYTPKLDVDSFKADRESQYLQQTGMPFSEAQAADAAAQREEQAATGMADDEFMAAQDDYVFQTTGVNGTELAKAVDLTPDQLISYIDSPDYATYNEQILNSGGDEYELAQIVQELTMLNPPLLRILETQYGLSG
jgi:hypothetical protein